MTVDGRRVAARLRAVLIAAAMVFIAAPSAAVPLFMGVGALSEDGGWLSRATGYSMPILSADGATVVGQTVSQGSSPADPLRAEAFRWTQAGGMQGLGDLSGGDFSSWATSTSADGTVVVGVSKSASGNEAFRWTEAGGIVGLGSLPGGSSSLAYGVSGDGSVVVGSSILGPSTEAFRWTPGGGMVGLGDLPGGSFESHAHDASADGSVVIGEATSASGTEAFRWTEAGGMVGLGDLLGGSFSSQAFGVSADGSVVVGGSLGAAGARAFRWTQADGMVDLGRLIGGISFIGSVALAVSADGSTVVGSSGSGSNPITGEAFIWDSTNGIRSVKELLTDLGLDMTGWTLFEAKGVSADGLAIAGWGLNPSGIEEVWYAYLPEPGMGQLLAPALLIVAGFATAQRRARTSQRLVLSLFQ